jgi:DNA-binding response OmpR family regulator
VGLGTDVALVDDDPVIAALVKRILSRQGYSVTWFADGQAAVTALCQADAGLQVKLVLLDVSIPGLGGFGVLQRLRNAGVLKRTRVIMLTASVSEQDVRHAVNLGATGYLAKPLDPGLLVDRIHLAFGRSTVAEMADGAAWAPDGTGTAGRLDDMTAAR